MIIYSIKILIEKKGKQSKQGKLDCVSMDVPCDWFLMTDI